MELSTSMIIMMISFLISLIGFIMFMVYVGSFEPELRNIGIILCIVGFVIGLNRFAVLYHYAKIGDPKYNILANPERKEYFEIVSLAPIMQTSGTGWFLSVSIQSEPYYLVNAKIGDAYILKQFPALRTTIVENNETPNVRGVNGVYTITIPMGSMNKTYKTF